MAARRTMQDVINSYKGARRRRDSEEIQQTSLELGAGLAKTGILAEIAPDNMSVTLWQPVPTEGGPAGFAIKKFRTVAAVPAPKYRGAPTHQSQTA